jgi:hypothetical protein
VRAQPDPRYRVSADFAADPTPTLAVPAARANAADAAARTPGRRATETTARLGSLTNMKLAIALVSVVVSTSCSRPARAEPSVSPAERAGAVAPGDTVYVRTINGRIRVVPSSGREVEPTARGGATVEVVRHDGGVTICGIPAAAEHRCRARGELSVSGQRPGGSSIDLEIALPADAKADLRSVNGTVTAVAGAEVKAETVNGDVSVRAAGAVAAETVNGEISVALSALGGRATIALETVNGSIALTLPRDANADLSASVVHGQISTQRPLATVERSRNTLEARLGRGGARLRLSSVNGSIRID